MSHNTLLVSDTMVKERTAIHGNIDPKLIYPEIKAAQDMYIMPILGTALYNKLLADVEGSGPIGDYKALIDNYIVDALIYYVLCELPVNISMQFWNKGVVRKQGADTELPSMSELIDLSNRYKNRAEFYANRLRLYLRQNAASKFSEYLNPGSGLDDVYPDKKSFTLPVFLGDDCDCANKSFEQKYQGNKPNCD